MDEKEDQTPRSSIERREERHWNGLRSDISATVLRAPPPPLRRHSRPAPAPTKAPAFNHRQPARTIWQRVLSRVQFAVCDQSQMRRLDLLSHWLPLQNVILVPAS
ncbi:hypothetical protein FA95DRAFT_947561 [Auriscalpium vulgare]|uniref:Uncharacterized protein n=1 Tax=Auriscalpium vulgare TaxID=40419 RepID=A0ACB8RY49_9AGAM|nr:hypothetical protein FA95DRAFT_947561 [Auriscalpium vulgare]